MNLAASPKSRCNGNQVALIMVRDIAPRRRAILIWGKKAAIAEKN
jgi:hypothetical protein